MPLTREQTKYQNTNDTVLLPILSVDKNFAVRGNSVFNGSATFSSIISNTIIKSGGISSQFLKADGSVDSSQYITGASPTITTPTITTPVIDTINASDQATLTSLYPIITTGTILIGTNLSTGTITLGGTGSDKAGTFNILTGATTSFTKTINIGTNGSTGSTTTINIGTTGGTSPTVTLNGTVNVNGNISINTPSPSIVSTNPTSASIFTSTVTGVTIGSSTIRTTAFPADGLVTTATASSGYMGMPQVSTATTRQFVATDAGKHIYVTATGQTLTIPAEGTVNFPIGTTIVVVNSSSVSTTIAITTDTLRLANTALTGSRTLASNGMCTILKIATGPGIWIVSGNGLT